MKSKEVIDNVYLVYNKITIRKTFKLTQIPKITISDTFEFRKVHKVELRYYR